MTTIVTRAGKGAPLTWNEGDANFNNLNAAVIDAQTTADSALVAATTTFTDVAIGVVPASGGGSTNFLRADGTWAAAGGSPGGADTEIQYNNTGAFDGDPDFTWNPTTKRLRVNAVDGQCTSPGNVQIYGGSATDANSGAHVQIHAGNGGINGGSGGRIELYAGDALYTGMGAFTVGGNLQLRSGYGDTGGEVTIEASNSADDVGSNIKLTAGTSGKNGSNGGDIWLIPGQGGAGGGKYGAVYVGTDLSNSTPTASFWRETGNTRFGPTKTDPTYRVQIDGEDANVALYITQGATAGTALSMWDSTASYNLNFQPGSTSYITYNAPLTFYCLGAQLTLSTTGVLNATGDVQIGGIPVRAIPQNSKSTDYTTVAADAGKHLLHPSADTSARTFTIDSNANVPYPIGTAITFVNQNSAGVLTIAITSDTMRLAGAGTTGSRTLAANGIATALKITSTEWIISGTGLT